MPNITEPMRDVIGRVLYEEPGISRDWYSLSEERREPWRQDADRIIDVLPIMADHFAEFAYHQADAKDTIVGCVFPTDPAKIWSSYLEFVKRTQVGEGFCVNLSIKASE